VKIIVIVEGKTEMAFRDILREFLRSRIAEGAPKLVFRSPNGRIPTGDKLRRWVELELQSGAQAVIALTDVYTGTRGFVDAADAKTKMRKWVGEEPRFHPHAAQYDFEAWLLPYWTNIQKLAGHNKAPPAGDPENVDHNRPPSARITEVFGAGKCRTHYNKVRDAKRILKDQDLLVAARVCTQLRGFLNTILRLSGGQTISDPPR
jgi:hypothetical protein